MIIAIYLDKNVFCNGYFFSYCSKNNQKMNYSIVFSHKTYC